MTRNMISHQPEPVQRPHESGGHLSFDPPVAESGGLGEADGEPLQEASRQAQASLLRYQTELQDTQRRLVQEQRLAAIGAMVAGWCEVSPFHPKQVFRNLLDNSLRLTGRPARITVRCTSAEIGGRAGVQIAVADNGPGFTAEQRQKAFEPFYTTKVHGPGLGLAICNRLVEAHGGRIAIGAGGVPGAIILITLPRRMS